MRSVIGPIALGLLITATGCVESTGYPTTYGYGYQPAPTYYAARPVYYQAPAYAPPPRVVAVPVYTTTAYAPPPPYRHHRHVRRDWDD